MPKSKEITIICNICGDISKAEVDDGYLDEYLELFKKCKKIFCNGIMEMVE